MIFSGSIRSVLAGALICLQPLAVHAQAADTRAPQAYMVDAGTGTILLSKEADKPFRPASLAKLVTLELAFAELASGKVDLVDTYKVSEHAWRTGGAPSRTSTMFAKPNSLVPVADLIQGAAVLQANDACIALGEGLAGSEAAFAQRMTARARELGMSGSTFVNATGLPADGHSTTVRDMALLAQHIWTAYPDRVPLFAQPQYEWNKIDQPNRNPLLKLGLGADGIASGYDEKAGYAIVTTASRNGRRTFLALAGLSSDKERTEEARQLLEWSDGAFRTLDLFADGETVGAAKTFGGTKSHVDLTAKGPISILVPVAAKERLIARIVYDGPVVAPIEAGLQVGRLKVWIGDRMAQETPLYAAESIGVGSLHRRALDAVEELLVGWLR